MIVLLFLCLVQIQTLDTVHSEFFMAVCNMGQLKSIDDS
jgi:hypothetical protein